MSEKYKYHASLETWQKFLIALVIVVIVVIAIMVDLSTILGLEILGLFVQISGIILLSLGLVRTNDDLVLLAHHPKHQDHQSIITHLATERFQIMLSLFLLVLGLLLQIIGIAL